jgi:hypothetical protein
MYSNTANLQKHGQSRYERPHNHQPDEHAITIAKCRDTMKRKAKLTLDKPHHIFTHANTQPPDDAKAYLPSSDTCKHVL